MKINEKYLQNIEAIRKEFKAGNPLAFIDFLEDFSFKDLQKYVAALRYVHEKHPLTHSYAWAKSQLSSSKFDQIRTYMLQILCTKITKLQPTFLSLQWGDYTILNDKAREKLGIDLIFNIGEWKQEWGGSVIYVDGSGEYTQLPLTSNTLCIIQRKKNVQKFIKYVNCRAGDKKRFLILFNLY